MKVIDGKLQEQLQTVFEELQKNGLDPAKIGPLPMFNMLLREYIENRYTLDRLMDNCKKMNIISGGAYTTTAVLKA